MVEGVIGAGARSRRVVVRGGAEAATGRTSAGVASCRVCRGIIVFDALAGGRSVGWSVVRCVVEKLALDENKER